MSFLFKSLNIDRKKRRAPLPPNYQVPTGTNPTPEVKSHLEDINLTSIKEIEITKPDTTIKLVSYLITSNLRVNGH